MYQPETITSKDLIPDGPYPVYGANGVIGRYDRFNHEEAQLLVTCRGATCGTVNVSEPRAWITGNSMVIRPKTGGIDLRFLEYMLRGGVDLGSAITGAAQPQITRANLIPITVRYPSSLQEQRRIVAILDEAFEGIATAKANAEKNLQNAHDLFDSELQSKFSHLCANWPTRPFASLVSETLIGLTRSAREQGEGLRCRYVKMNNISTKNQFDSSARTYVAATDEEVRRFGLRAGDFLFNTRNSHELVGKSCVIDNLEDDEVIFNNNIMRIRFHKNIHPKFVLYSFSFNGTRTQLESMKNGTTNVAAIYYRDLAMLQVPLPDGPTQAQVTSALSVLQDESERLATTLRRKLTALDDLKKSLLHQAFTGQL